MLFELRALEEHMTRQQFVIAIAVITSIAGFTTSNLLGGQSAESEVRAIHDRYYEYFAAGQAGDIAERIYYPNRMAFTATGVTVTNNQADVEEGFQNTLAHLATEQYDHSELISPSICAPNPRTVFVSGMFRRYRKDGSVLAELGQTYIYGMTDDGWKIHATIGHAPETVLGCL